EPRPPVDPPERPPRPRPRHLGHADLRPHGGGAPPVRGGGGGGARDPGGPLRAAAVRVAVREGVRRSRTALRTRMQCSSSDRRSPLNGQRPALVFGGGLAPPLPHGSRSLPAQPTPAGPETRVDTTAADPACSQIGVAPDRSFEISWGYGGTLPMYIKARHYAASGAPTDPSDVLIGALEDIPEVRLVSPVSGGFRDLIAIVDDVVGDPVKFYQRRLSLDGVPVPGLPRTVATPPGTRWVSAGPGDSLLAGTYDLASHRYSVLQINPPGQPAGTSHVVNSRPLDDGPGTPVIAKLADGGWVAAFAGTTLPAPGTPARQVLRARRFNAA